MSRRIVFSILNRNCTCIRHDEILLYGYGKPEHFQDPPTIALSAAPSIPFRPTTNQRPEL